MRQFRRNNLRESDGKTTKIILVVVFVLTLGFFGFHHFRSSSLSSSYEMVQKSAESSSTNKVLGVEDMENSQSQPEEPPKPAFIPGPISMETIKTKGCVADGLLSGYGGDTDKSVEMVKNSKCQYFHRALETWLKPPDFDKAEKILRKIDRKDVIYGMFIAEALNKKSKLYYPDEDRQFDFNDMCRPDSKNYWGEHTCKPDLDKKEYRKYVKFITERAMDLGIQSFMFGQVFYQDDTDYSKSQMPEIIQEMRDYASQKGLQIVIGAQTNDVTDERYLKLFDYIEGGVGLSSDGEVEDGPCFSRWWKKPGDWCWALLWHDAYRKKANNVLVHLDWRGSSSDDMGVFSRMDKDTRKDTLENLYKKFTSQDVGFLMPYMATLDKNNGGCYGPKKGFYSASDHYKCRDEDNINSILD